MLHRYLELPVCLYMCPYKTVVLVLSACDVSVIRRFSFVVEIMKNHDWTNKEILKVRCINQRVKFFTHDGMF